jgi:hypothetical protein
MAFTAIIDPLESNRLAGPFTNPTGRRAKGRGGGALENINLLAVIVAAVSAFALGGAWYSPLLFGEAWLRESGADPGQGEPWRIFAGAFILSLLAAGVFAIFLGPEPGFGFATGAGLAAGLFWVASSFGINYLFSQRSLRLFLIDGGYHTVQFTLYGMILGLWH